VGDSAGLKGVDRSPSDARRLKRRAAVSPRSTPHPRDQTELSTRGGSESRRKTALLFEKPQASQPAAKKKSTSFGPPSGPECASPFFGADIARRTSARPGSADDASRFSRPQVRAEKGGAGPERSLKSIADSPPKSLSPAARAQELVLKPANEVRPVPPAGPYLLAPARRRAVHTHARTGGDPPPETRRRRRPQTVRMLP